MAAKVERLNMQQTLLQVNYGLPLEANRAYTDVQCSRTALSKVQVLSKKGYLILKIEKGYLCYEIATKTYTDLLMINDSIYWTIYFLLHFRQGPYFHDVVYQSLKNVCSYFLAKKKCMLIDFL